MSKWDVSSVIDMEAMFYEAEAFNKDLSKWDVSRVTDMQAMFYEAAAFAQKLCTAAWVHTKTDKHLMFVGSSGSISRTVCAITTTPPVFSPQSRAELKSAVDAWVDEKVRGSEAASPDTGSDHATFACKPAVCLDKSCNPIG